MADNLAKSACPPLGVVDVFGDEFDDDFFSVLVRGVNVEIFGVL